MRRTNLHRPRVPFRDVFPHGSWYAVGMRTKLLVCVCVSMLSLVACKRGLESKDCVDYFAKNEACAAKAPKIKGDVMRQTASVTKANFEKNASATAVQQSCKIMLEALSNDPDCK